MLLLGIFALLFALGQGPRAVSADVVLAWTNMTAAPYALGETSAGILTVGQLLAPLLRLCHTCLASCGCKTVQDSARQQVAC